MSQARSLDNRIHPLIATIDEASANPDILFSDHLPAIAEIPSEDPSSPYKIITWNVYNPGYPWGFAAPEEFFYSPPEEESKTREQRNIAAILNFIQKQGPDVMVFQEAGGPKSFSAETLKSALVSIGWEVDSGRGMAITIYNANKFNKIELAKPTESNLKYNYLLAHVKTGLVEKDSKNDKPDLIINNVYLGHNDFPIETEEFMTEMLNNDARQYGATSVIAGDFNNRYVPISAKEGENIITGATPAYFRREQYQGADWTDGFFYQQAEDKEAHQPKVMEILDPASGAIFPRSKRNYDALVNAKSALSNEVEKDKVEELIRVRPFLSFAAEHLESDKLNQQLKIELKKLGLDFCKVSNSINSQPFQYCISSVRSQEYDLFIRFLNDNKGINLETTSLFKGMNNLNDRTALITKEQLPKFQNAVESFLELGAARRHVYSTMNSKNSLSVVIHMNEIAAESKSLSLNLHQAIKDSMTNYKVAVANAKEKSSFFKPSKHGKTGLKRAANLLDESNKIQINGSLLQSLNIISDHLKENTSLRDDSFSTFLMKEIVKNTKLRSFLHLDDLAFRRISTRDKLNKPTKVYDLNLESDRVELKGILLNKINENIEFQKDLWRFDSSSNPRM